MDNLSSFAHTDIYTIKNQLGLAFKKFTDFDIAEMNYQLKKIPRWYAKFYEQQGALSDQQIDFIVREH